MKHEEEKRTQGEELKEKAERTDDSNDNTLSFKTDENIYLYVSVTKCLFTCLKFWSNLNYKSFWHRWNERL